MAYDAVGRIINRTDYAGDASGYQYYAADRVRSQTFADGSVLSWSYTPSGRSRPSRSPRTASRY